MSNNEFIRHVEGELGRSLGFSQAPRQFLDLQGTSAEDCLLPSIKSEEAYRKRYGFPRPAEQEFGLGMIRDLTNELGDALDRFQELAKHRVGQDVIDAAHVFLRQVSRAERAFEPLLAGLPMSTYGSVRAACIHARAEVANILDQKAMAGEL